MARRRVVITGLGLISPVGNDVTTGWGNIVAGRSGISRISRFDVENFPIQIAGEVRDFDASQWISAKDARRMDTFIHYGMAAGIQLFATPVLKPLQALTPNVSASSSARALAACR